MKIIAHPSKAQLLTHDKLRVLIWIVQIDHIVTQGPEVLNARVVYGFLTMFPPIG